MVRLLELYGLEERHSTEPRTARNPGETIGAWLRRNGVDPSSIKTVVTDKAWHVSPKKNWKQLEKGERVRLRSGIPDDLYNSNRDEEEDRNPQEDNTTPRVSFASHPYYGVSSSGRGSGETYAVFRIAERQELVIPSETVLPEKEDARTYDEMNFCLVVDQGSHSEMWYVDDTSMKGVEVEFVGYYTGAQLFKLTMVKPEDWERVASEPEKKTSPDARFVR